MDKFFRRLWPVFFLLALGCACAGCYVAQTKEGFTDLRAVESMQPIANAVNKVVEPVIGLPIEDIGGAVVDGAKDATGVATGVASGNYTAAAASLASLVAALTASIAYRKRRAALRKAQTEVDDED